MKASDERTESFEIKTLATIPKTESKVVADGERLIFAALAFLNYSYPVTVDLKPYDEMTTKEKVSTIHSLIREETFRDSSGNESKHFHENLLPYIEIFKTHFNCESDFTVNYIRRDDTLVVSYSYLEHEDYLGVIHTNATIKNFKTLAGKLVTTIDKDVPENFNHFSYMKEDIFEVYNRDMPGVIIANWDYLPLVVKAHFAKKAFLSSKKKND